MTLPQQPQFITLAPSPRLQDFVSHYWLSLDKAVHVALPDGAVDIVIQTDGNSAGSWVYGTPTRRLDVPLLPSCRYLGIRFQPGQSRHFIDVSARELTDNQATTAELLRLALEDVPEQLARGGKAPVNRINQLLESHLDQSPPEKLAIDQAIQAIATNHGTQPIREVASDLAMSYRQFERIFVDTVGVSAKCFARIVRFRRAIALTTAPFHLPLAQVAADLGYTDQSHMTREFKQFAGVSPKRLLREGVDFLQDFPSP